MFQLKRWNGRSATCCKRPRHFGWSPRKSPTERSLAYLSAEFRERAETWCAVAQHVCYLSGIAVAPPFRRQGIARALFAELKREAAARGATNIELDVWAFNEEARQVFARLGFRVIMQRMSLSH